MAAGGTLPGEGGTSPQGGSGGAGGAAGGTGGSGGGAGNAGAGGQGGGAATGSCIRTLPTLAEQTDTSFYANRPNIKHGSIATVTPSSSTSKTMRVYTPPDYATSGVSYPVLYINHGGGENDSHWGCTTGYSCGYAGLILDNLLADGKAVPMIIAMPNTSDCANFNPPAPPDFADPCTTQYVNDFIPYVEKNYRVQKDRNSRAIAGLSMGGLVVMNTGLAHLELFSHIFIYSSGYDAAGRPTWEKNGSALLGNAKATNQLLNAPVYIAAGDTDIALPNATAVRDILKKDGIAYLWQQSSLGHEWGNWRRYLAQTLPLMFKNTSGCN